MSLRFLTRRRDRDRDRDRSTQASSSFDKQTSSTCVILPSNTLKKGKLDVPSEVQIITWHSNHCETAGREVHIRSRDDFAPSKTPVYHAFTSSASHPDPAFLIGNAASTNNSAAHVVADQKPSYRSHAPNVPTRGRPGTAPHSRDCTSSESFFDPTSSVPVADIPRREPVEELDPSRNNPRTGQEAERSLPIRLASKTRRTKSHSHQSGAAYDANPDEHSFSGIPSSLPSYSRLPFSSLHRNASMQSLASFISFSGCKEVSANDAETSSSGGGLMARIPSTRYLRRSKNASSVEIDYSSTQEARAATSRSHSASLSSMPPKFLRKESGHDPPTPSKIRLRGAPPSAWKCDVGGTDGSGGGSSSCSSDYETSTGAGSLSGHADSNATSAQTYGRKGSSDTTLSHNLGPPCHLLSPPLHASDFTSTRLAATTPRSPASPAQPLDIVQPSPRSSTLSSPIVLGLPLPSPDPSPATLTSLFATQLVKRLGPPPVGLPPYCFDDRVSLIQSYVQSQVPPLPCPKSSTGDFSTTQRSSLPPLPRSSDTRTTALEDEFDKLECQTEQQMLTLFVQKGGGGAVVGQLRLEEAFLEARRRCGVDARRSHFELKSLSTSPQCMSQRDALSIVQTGTLGSGLGGIEERKVGMGVQGLGVSLKPAPRRRRGAGGRRPITAPESTAQPPSAACINRGRGTFTEAQSRPSTSRSTLTQLSEDSPVICAAEPLPAGSRELFTPQSFSSKPLALPSTTGTLFNLAEQQSDRPSYPPPAPSSTRLRRGSSDRDSSSSHTHRSSVKSPLFFGHPQHPQHPSLMPGRMNSAKRNSQDTVATQETEASCESLAREKVRVTPCRMASNPV